MFPGIIFLWNIKCEVVQASQLADVKAQFLTKSFCSQVTTLRKNVDAQGREKSKGYVTKTKTPSCQASVELKQFSLSTFSLFLGTFWLKLLYCSLSVFNNYSYGNKFLIF